jgi:CelD/BcsL family acetyltransferase involved in cellulose biosynthesis
MIMLTQAATTPSAATLGITVDVIADEHGFTRLQGEWDGLLASSASDTPFLAWAWMRAWSTHLAGSAALRVMAVRDRGELVAIAPLMLTRRGFASTLEFLGIGGAGADYLDIIVRVGRERDALEALTTTLHALQLPLYLDHLPPASLAARLQTMLAPNGWTAIESSPDVCPCIDLAGHANWDSYLATLGSAHRANVRRRLRAIAAGFDVRFAKVETEDDRRSALSVLIDLNRERWATRGGTTAFESPDLCDFHDEVTWSALRDGTLRLYTLALNGVVVAVMYGFVRQQRFFFFQHGFSEAYAKTSIGLVLMARTIQAALAEGLTGFDMLYGHESYKKLWARDERRLGRLQLFPPRLGGTLLRRRADTRRALGVLASQLGLKAHRDPS